MPGGGGARGHMVQFTFAVCRREFTFLYRENLFPIFDLFQFEESR